LEPLDLAQKNNCWPVDMWIKRAIINNEYFVGHSIEYPTKACDRPYVPQVSKDRGRARVVTRTLNYLEQLPGPRVRIHKAENLRGV